MRVASIIILLVVLFGVVLFVVPAFRGDIQVPADIYLGGLRLRLYGLIMAVSILAAYFLAVRLGRRVGVSEEHIAGALPWAVIFGFLGARVYYVAFSWQYFGAHLLEIFKVWHGGLAIYGGIVGGILGVYLYAKKNKVAVWRFLDLLAVSLPLAQALGRWGNFFNQEAFGRPTDLPWRMYVDPARRPLSYLEQKFFHPAFLYESLWDLTVFLLLLFMFKRQEAKRRPGFLAGSYLIFYSLGRFFIEPLRVDSFFLGSLRVDQIVSLLMMALGTVIIFYDHEKSAVENN